MCYELFETNEKKEVGQKVRDDAWVCSDLDLTYACSITRAPQCKCVCDFASRSYWIQEVCRVPAALGEAQKTLGKGFAECYTRQTTFGKRFDGKR